MPNSEKYVGGSHSNFRKGVGRLSVGDALGLTAALRSRLPDVKTLRKALEGGGKPGDVPTFVPPDAPHPKDSPRNERGELRQPFGEQFVELLGEFIDAKLDYAEARQGPAAEFADPDKVYEAGNRLQALLDERFP